MINDEKFQNWCDMWDKAQKSDLFKDAPKPHVPTQQVAADDYFGNHGNTGSPSLLREVDAKYWNKVFRLSKGLKETSDILTEEAPVKDKDLAPTTKPDGKSVANITDDMGGLANPVSGTTRGPDASNRVTPDWAGGEHLTKLNTMKNDLQKLEDKVAADPMGEDNGSKKVLTQLTELKKKIDELSSSLNPKFDKEYLS